MGSDKIPKLTSSNYTTWALLMQALLVTKDLWEYVRPLREGEEELPAEQLDDPRGPGRAKSTLMLNVEPQFLQRMGASTSARAAWQMLEATFVQITNCRLLTLRKSFYSLRREPSESMPQYIDKARAIAAELALIGHGISDQDLSNQVLIGLPQEFEHVYQVLKLQAAPTLDDILSAVLDTEQNRMQRHEPSAAAYAATAHHKGRPFGGRTPQPRSAHSSSSSSQGRYAMYRCNSCKQMGHIAKDCPMSVKGSGSGGGGNGSGSSSWTRGSAPASGGGSKQFALASSAVEPPTDMWLLDSGATEHITPDQSLFITYKTLESPIIVHFANDTTAEAVGYGAVVLPASIMSSMETIKLKKVLYVPDAKYNLISVQQLGRGGSSVMFNSSGASVLYDGDELIRADNHPSGYLVPAMRLPSAASASACVRAQPETAELWHARYAHLSYISLGKLVNKDLVTGINVNASDFNDIKEPCETCIMSKSVRAPFPSSNSTRPAPLSLVHMDVNGPLPVASLGGSKYMLTFLDDYTKISFVRFVANKSDVARELITTLQFMETQSGCKLQAVRTDRGSEFVNATVTEFLSNKGAVHEKSAAYTPQQNGAAERLNRTLMNSVRAMLQESGLPSYMWAEAAHTASHLRNLAPSADNDKTPYELFWREKPDVSYLRIFGCDAYVYVPKELRNKLQPTAIKGTFVGYEFTPKSKNYRVMIDGNVKPYRDVTFNEKIKTNKATGNVKNKINTGDNDAANDGMPGLIPDPSDSDSDDDNNVPMRRPRVNADIQPGNDDNNGIIGNDGGSSSGGDDNNGDDGDTSGGNDSPQQPRRSGRNRRLTDRYAEYVGARSAIASNIPEPKTVAEALSSDYTDLWLRAMDEEMESLLANNTWELVPRPIDYKVLVPKWVFKVKYNPDGSLERCKARVVVKGFMQQEGIDFFDVFAPTSKHVTMRVLLALAAYDDMFIEHLDVKTAFLNGELEETIYMQQPDGYVGDPNKVCRLIKSLYGLKQAPRAWFLKLKSELEAMGFTASKADPSLYFKVINGIPVYILVFVDDIMVICSDKTVSAQVKTDLMKRFDIRDLGNITRFIGIRVTRYEKLIKIDQTNMINEMVKKFNMDDAKTKIIPMSPSIKLVKTVPGNELNTVKFPYRELIGSLLYVSVCTRPDISYSVGVLARHMSNPSLEHWHAAKDVLRYLSGTADYGIYYGNGELSLSGFCDADYAGDLSTRRSTTAYVFMLNGGIISWSSRLQPTVALSTTEAEYMAAAAATKEVLWLRTLLSELGIITGTITISADNQAAIKLLKNPVISNRSKHIDVQHHFAREHVVRKDVDFAYVPTDSMLADIMTKALPENKFVKHLTNMGMRE
jgi:hypothetical protein